ncbi:IucA/IucC family protein [Paenibacillus sp. FSL H8-0537]|uniref:IucA/IucC family protein n=1 Tax=Paenibacillus sp. FSL H8-0537 TaxID=2921399 RepID=UPI0031011806
MSQALLNQDSLSGPSIQRSEKESISRLLNAYLRESGQFEPSDVSFFHPEITKVVWLPHTNLGIYGTILHLSAGGHHVFGDHFYTEEDQQWKKSSLSEITHLVLDEISFVEEDSTSKTQKRTELEALIHNSQQRMYHYLAYAAEKEQEQGEKQLDFRYLEQALLCGHPFHPTPKSLQGFTVHDSQAYSPEFGASFPLHCFAAAPAYIAEDWLEGRTKEEQLAWIPPAMKAAAAAKLGAASSDYALLPCHPWQAEYVRSLAPVQNLLEQGLLVDLGDTGPLVYPTSSVRTVWNPEQACFYKLSLHIRITNFIRENTPEQLLRTLDASRAIDAIRGEYATGSFKLLLEEGYRTLRLPNAEPSLNEEIMSAFSMIVREAPEECTSAEEPPLVIASLLEVPPGHSEPLLFRAVRQALHPKQPDWTNWLRQYLHLSMKPLLHLYAETGISLEAHVQNAMLRLHQGMPATFYVRDLEGISINVEMAEQRGWINTLLREDSPVLYSEEQTRHRLKYYFFVNHLSHLIARISYYSGQEEQVYWAIASNVLHEIKHASSHALLHNLITDLLTSATLPAKANLLSRFHQRGETPLYVEIPNPMRIEVQ